jgi:DNA-binding GntR family transcriptional regulator
MEEQSPKDSATSGTVSEHTYQSLLSMILSKELRPGQVVEERPLSERMNISRTPMRMALSRLLGEGMISRLSNGLLVVKEVGIEEFFELVHLRTLLESEAARLAAGRIRESTLQDLRDRIKAMAAEGIPDSEKHWQIDDELHEMIADASGNRWLARVIGDVRRRVRMCNIDRLPKRFHETCMEHIAILDALQAADSDLASESMKSHLDRVRQGFISLLNLR